MFRTLIILKHTFLESILQPIYPLLLIIGAAILAIFAALPFFTLGEDTVMYKAVGLDIILLLVLIVTLFATSRSIFDEIEDRTMLTLMSKPVKRWEVLVGKYAGIVIASLLAIVILGAVLALCIYARIPMDYQISSGTLDEDEIKRLSDLRWMHLAGLPTAVVNSWLQISVLAAVGVALSTRFSLVVNLPTVIFIYIAGNLTRFLFPIVFTGSDAGTPLEGRSAIVKGLAWVLSLVFPYLEAFDDRHRTIYSKVAVPGTQYVADGSAVSFSSMFAYTGSAAIYAAAYVVFALGLGMWLFQTRELGGAEG